MPLEVDTLALFVNSDLFSAAGLTPPKDFFKEFGDDAAHLTVRDATGSIVTAGAGMGKYDSVTHAPDVVAMLMAQDKGGVNFSKIADDKDKVTEVLAYYTQFGTGDNAVWADTLGTTIDAFAAGKLAMFLAIHGIFRLFNTLIQHSNFKLFQFRCCKELPIQLLPVIG